MASHTSSSSYWKHANATVTSPSASINVANSSPYQFRIHCVDVPAYGKRSSSTPGSPKGTILLIHGFPQTWWQYRHVLGPLSEAGYRLIVPDYRGAGNSQVPPSNAGYAGGRGGGYTKLVMADDLRTVVRDVLGVKDKIHVIGHDIGAMIAHAYASFFPEDTASLVYIDCPLPGSTVFASLKSDHPDKVWHFVLHSVEDDLPEKLIEGRERIYIRNFFDRLSVNPWAIRPGGEDEDTYVLAYSRPGALRAAFDTYRTFDEDARENREQVRKVGKSKVPALAIAGAGSFNDPKLKEQLDEFYESVEKVSIANSGHWVVEEAPEEFVEKTLAWLGRPTTH